MPLLFYWKPDNYHRDLDMGVGFHLNQGNRLLHEIELGDSVWAFTRQMDGRYAIAAELVVRAKTTNPPNFRYGHHRVWGDLNDTRYLRVDGQPNCEELLRGASGRRSARIFARGFQGHAGVCSIDTVAHDMLVEWTRGFKAKARARLLPEERLEAEVLLGDERMIRELIESEHPGLAQDRRRYLYQLAPSRNRQLTQELQNLYDGLCQICRWSPCDLYAQSLCEAHHIVWLSRGGTDELENLALLCPNHHRAVHRCDAPLDWGTLAFLFPDGRAEPLELNNHLPTYGETA